MSSRHPSRDRRNGHSNGGRSAARLPSPTGEAVSRADDGPASVHDGRGRRADSPREIPARGWKDIALRVKEEVKADNLALLAAGVASYFMLSLFPALIATVSVYGLVADPITVEEQVGKVLTILPPEAGGLIATQLREIGHGAKDGLGLSLVLSVLVALWSASKGAKALLTGLNVAYEETEDRGFVKQQLAYLGFTLGFVLFAATSIGLIAVLPNVVDYLPLGALATGLTFVLTWALLLAILLFGLAVLYRYGPSRNNPRWQWVSVGSALAAALWLIASLAFSWYASNFGSFNETYGTLAGGVLLLLWLQITAYVTLLGGEVNAEMEHQTAEDSTVGPPKPMGQRDATMADTLGAALGQADKEERRGAKRGDGSSADAAEGSRRGGRPDPPPRRGPGRGSLS